jgi:hypothetical protein
VTKSSIRDGHAAAEGESVSGGIAEENEKSSLAFFLVKLESGIDCADEVEELHQVHSEVNINAIVARKIERTRFQVSFETARPPFFSKNSSHHCRCSAGKCDAGSKGTSSFHSS